MAASTTLLQFLLMVVAGWLQRQQAATIDYPKAENRVVVRKNSIRAIGPEYEPESHGMMSA
jgi:hypothetical protein